MSQITNHNLKLDLLNIIMKVALKALLAYLSPFSNKIVSIYHKCEIVY